MAATDMYIGICDVTWNSVLLGETDGSVVITHDVSTSKNSSNNTPATDGAVTDESWKVTCKLKEAMLMTLMETLNLGTKVTGVSDSKVTIDNLKGTLLSSLATTLTLHPHGVAAGTKNKDYVFPKAVPLIKGDMEYSNENGMVVPVEFEILYDATNSTWGTMGDPTVVVDPGD